jgi:hypothetical protein
MRGLVCGPEEGCGPFIFFVNEAAQNRGPGVPGSRPGLCASTPPRRRPRRQRARAHPYSPCRGRHRRLGHALSGLGAPAAAGGGRRGRCGERCGGGARGPCAEDRAPGPGLLRRWLPPARRRRWESPRRGWRRPRRVRGGHGRGLLTGRGRLHEAEGRAVAEPGRRAPLLAARLVHLGRGEEEPQLHVGGPGAPGAPGRPVPGHHR